MIDVKTGHLIIDSEHIVSPQTTLADIEQWQLGAVQKTRKMGNACNWVDVKNLKIGQQYLNISFLFQAQRICGFTFVFQDKAYELNPSWASWSKANEQENLKRFRTWLEEHFGEQRTLKWGKISAAYNAKSAASTIELRYAND